MRELLTHFERRISLHKAEGPGAIAARAAISSGITNLLELSSGAGKDLLTDEQLEVEVNRFLSTLRANLESMQNQVLGQLTN